MRVNHKTLADRFKHLQDFAVYEFSFTMQKSTGKISREIWKLLHKTETP